MQPEPVAPDLAEQARAATAPVVPERAATDLAEPVLAAMALVARVLAGMVPVVQVLAATVLAVQALAAWAWAAMAQAVQVPVAQAVAALTQVRTRKALVISLRQVLTSRKAQVTLQVRPTTCKLRMDRAAPVAAMRPMVRPKQPVPVNRLPKGLVALVV